MIKKNNEAFSNVIVFGCFVGYSLIFKVKYAASRSVLTPSTFQQMFAVLHNNCDDHKSLLSLIG